jgi:hypothetical protein
MAGLIWLWQNEDEEESSGQSGGGLLDRIRFPLMYSPEVERPRQEPDNVAMRMAMLAVGGGLIL